MARAKQGAKGKVKMRLATRVARKYAPATGGVKYTRRPPTSQETASVHVTKQNWHIMSPQCPLCFTVDPRGLMSWFDIPHDIREEIRDRRHTFRNSAVLKAEHNMMRCLACDEAFEPSLQQDEGFPVSKDHLERLLTGKAVGQEDESDAEQTEVKIPKKDRVTTGFDESDVSENEEDL